MAIEYAGYVPTTKQVNWESLTDKFAEKVETSISARKEERKALDQIAFDNQNLINKQELGKTQALNEFVTKEGFKGKTFINDLNKDLINCWESVNQFSAEILSRVKMAGADGAMAPRLSSRIMRPVQSTSSR